tara:strand:+ start:432 stop:2540 length:2109 start_codon:yes stop_codon:yes gene_type:complete
MNQVIELRQLGTDTIQYSDSTGKIINGDYKTRLKKPITLNQGDTLRLNQIFLQTEELEDDQIKIDNDITLKVNFHRYIRDVINQIQPRYDQLTNLTGAGEAIDIANTPSTIVQQNNLSVTGGGAVPEGLPNAGDFCSFIRTGEVMVETLTLNSDGVNTAAVKQIKDITFKKIDPTINTLPQSVLLKYINALGEESIITEEIPALIDQNSSTILLDLVGKDIGAGVYMTVVNSNILQKNNLILDSVDIGFTIQNVACLCTPVSQSRTITIPSGIYHSSELATVITDQFNDTDLENRLFINTEEMLANTFLGIADNTVGIGKDNSDFPNENAFGTSNGLRVFVNQTGENFNIYGTFKKKAFGGASTVEAIPNKPNILCGTDSFSLEYDESLSKYKITKIHYSINDLNGNTSNQILDNPEPEKIYDAGGSSFTGTMLNRAGQASNQSALGVAFGGIIITALSAYDINGNFINFWEDTLGFDTFQISTHIRQSFTVNTIGTTTAVKHELTQIGSTNLGGEYQTLKETLTTFIFQVQDGVNITTDQATISGIHYADSFKVNATTGRILADSNHQGHQYFNVINPFNDGSTTIVYNQFINTTLTKQIFARDIFQSKNLNFAYYLVEINALVDNDFISSEDIKRNIFSVINRYYQNGGYLSGTNSGIQYMHEGQSIMISDIQVRILQADGTIADNLKNDNTVFLELLRG